MANFINKYADQAAYNADNTKQYPNVSLLANTQEIVYERSADYSKKYFTTVALSDGTIDFSGSSATNLLSYSTDEGQTWTAMTAQTVSVPVNEGDRVMWKGEATPVYDYGIGNFSNTAAEFNAEGNIMSLLYGDNFLSQTDLTGKDYAFYQLFSGNTQVVSAENLVLPATTLAEFCYQDMFNGCTSLTSAPELPATTLANYCYNCMFVVCTSLTAAPQLPATTLAENCYEAMFGYCTNLNSITCLATDISADMCTANWTYGVAASGTFYKASSMTSWTTGIDGIPNGWTVQDA